MDDREAIRHLTMLRSAKPARKASIENNKDNFSSHGQYKVALLALEAEDKALELAIKRMEEYLANTKAK